MEGTAAAPFLIERGRLFGVMVQTELRRGKGYEISYCTTGALSNIQSELVQAQEAEAISLRLDGFGYVTPTWVFEELWFSLE